MKALQWKSTADLFSPSLLIKISRVINALEIGLVTFIGYFRAGFCGALGGLIGSRILAGVWADISELSSSENTIYSPNCPSSSSFVTQVVIFTYSPRRFPIIAFRNGTPLIDINLFFCKKQYGAAFYYKLNLKLNTEGEEKNSFFYQNLLI